MASVYPDSIKVFIDFDNGALSATQTWTEVTQWVTGQVKSSYGRSNAVDDFQPGTGTLTLDNRDGRFDPSNAAGPYYGKLKLRRRLKIDVTQGATTWTVARGWVDGWPQTPQYRAITYVNLTFRDAMSVMATLPMPDSVFDYQIRQYGSAVWCWYRNDDSTATAVDHSGNERHGRWNVWEGNGAPWIGLPAPNTTIAAGTVDSPVVAASAHIDPRNPTSPAGGSRKGKDVAKMLADVGQPLGGIAGAPRSVSLVLDYQYWRSGQLLQADFSFEIWMTGRQAFPLNVTGAASSTSPVDQPLMEWGYAGGKRWDFRIASYGNPIVVIQDGTGAQTATNGAPNSKLLDGQPHQIVWTFNKSTGVLRCYVDGVATGNTSSITSFGAPNFHPATIGANTGDPFILESVIGDVIFYTKELTLTEVAKNWYAGRYGSLDTNVSQQTTKTAVAQALTMAGASTIPFENDVVAGHDIMVGDIQGKNLGEYLKRIATSEQGMLFYRPDGKLVFRGSDWPVTMTNAKYSQATFSDAAGASYGYSTVRYRSGADHLANDVTVNFPGGSQRFKSDTSITDYGPVTQSLDTFLTDPAQAVQLGALRVAQWGDPQSHSVVPEQIEIHPSTSAEWITVLNFEPGFRITLQSTRPNGTVMSGDYWIQQITHEFEAAGQGDWKTTVSVSPADNPARPFTFDESLFDSTDALWL